MLIIRSNLRLEDAYKDDNIRGHTRVSKASYTLYNGLSFWLINSVGFGYLLLLSDYVAIRYICSLSAYLFLSLKSYVSLYKGHELVNNVACLIYLEEFSRQ